VRARRRSADSALIELTDAVLRSGKLAILALHPHDPDAMALHITLFGTQALEPDRLEEDYGFRPEALDPWRCAAWERGRRLRFLVGGVEEVFTQCSQNLFIKRPAADPAAPRHAAAWPNAWERSLGLERLLNAQFEILQATVSASGLPGASPRNGDRGKAAYVGRRGARTFVLIPYFPGNAVHGHAAKLWSNPYAALVIWDDHCALSAITISGPSWTVAHRTVEKDFPAIAADIATRQNRKGAAPHPEYWFLQEVAEIVQQVEPLAANSLDPSRSTCSIHAGGLAHHGKKAAYFAADTVPPYDQALQHEREAAGRPIDPTGRDGYIFWAFEMAPALEARRAHLDRLCA
jgi:hypothetical protein